MIAIDEPMKSLSDADWGLPQSKATYGLRDSGAGIPSAQIACASNEEARHACIVRGSGSRTWSDAGRTRPQRAQLQRMVTFADAFGELRDRSGSRRRNGNVHDGIAADGGSCRGRRAVRARQRDPA